MDNERQDAAWKLFEDAHWSDDHTCNKCDSQESAFRTGFDAGYAAREGGWTAINSVDDLPKDDGRYLVTVQSPPYSDNPDPKNNKLRELDFDVKNGYWSLYRKAIVAKSVVAWRPLPHPYQPDEKPAGDKGE